MPRAAPVIAMVLPRMLSMRPNFTHVKFWLEVPLAGNSGAMATVEPELAYAMTYVVQTSNPLDPTIDSPWGARQYWQGSEATLDGPGVSGDGFWRPDVRTQFVTDDGAIVLMYYTGLVEQTSRFAEAAEAAGPQTGPTSTCGCPSGLRPGPLATRG